MRAIARNVLLGVLVAGLPLLLGAGLLWAHWQASYAELVPFWSDELYYWHQAQTWRVAAWSGGYYTVSEHLPRLAWSRFYVWGAFSPALYGALGGDSLQSVWRVNVSALVAGCMLAAAGLSWRRAVMLAVLLAVSPLPLSYMPSSMQELLHVGVALGAAAGFARLLRGERWTRGLLVAWLLAATLLRPTWGLLLLPALVLGETRPKQIAARLLAFALLFGAFSALFQASSAPYPHFRSQFFAQAATPLDALSALWNYVWHNVGLLFGSGTPTAFWQRAHIVGLVLVLTGVWAWERRRGTPVLTTAEWGLHLFNLLAVYLAVLTLHEVEDGRDYRVLAPHLFFSASLLVLRGRWRVLLPLLLAFALSLPDTLQEYVEFHAPRFKANNTATQLARWQPVIGAYLAYEAGASAWCNTVSASVYYIADFASEAGLLLAIPRGMGITWINPDDVPTRFQARYLLLADWDVAAWQARLNITPMVRVRDGTVYRNLDAACD